MKPTSVVLLAAAVAAVGVAVAATLLAVAMIASDGDIRLLAGYTFVAWLTLAAVLSRLIGMVIR